MPIAVDSHKHYFLAKLSFWFFAALCFLFGQITAFAQEATQPASIESSTAINTTNSVQAASSSPAPTAATALTSTAPTAKFYLPSLFADHQQLGLDVPMSLLAIARDLATTPDQLMQNPLAAQFTTWQPGTALPTSELQDVWLRLQLPKQIRPQSWMLRIPRLTLEKATVFQTTPGPSESSSPSAWQQQSAGLAVPNSSWPVRARDPVFEISTRSDQTQLLFIRLQNIKPVTESIQLIHSSAFGNGANHAGTLNGLIIGIFTMITLMSLISWRIHRNSQFGWLAVLCVSALITQLTGSGYMLMRIWPDSVYLAKIAGWVMPLLAMGAMARFAISVSYARDLSKPIFYGLWVLIALCALAIIGILAFPASFPREPLNAAYAAGMLMIVGSLSSIAWRSQRWLWLIVVSLLPILISTLARLAYNLGWVAHIELALLAGVVTAGLGMIGIYTTLIGHQRERVALIQNENALETTDAATGLFNERIARARLPQIILRSKRSGNGCGAVLVRWTGAEELMIDVSFIERGRIFAHLGHRLNRLARDIDTVARFGDDQFLFLIEAPVSQEQLTALASQILSTCMRPSPALPENKGFDMHLAVWLSSDMPTDATDALELLETRINQMREGTQRRVQFINTPLTTAPSQDQSDPEHGRKLIDKINNLEATHELPTFGVQPREFVGKI
jgi:two-component system, sensor histidine kinase LadS